MNLRMYRGDTAEFRVTALDIDGNPLDITGASAWFTAKRTTSDDDLSAVFQKTVGDGITITDAPNGIMLVRLAEADTASVTGREYLEYDLQVKDTSDGVWTVARGSLLVEADVTRTSA
jgi:hypothetical protein